MKPADLIRMCADAIDTHELYGFEAAFLLQWPKGSKGRFPFKAELMSENELGRVYRVLVGDVLAYIARVLKAERKSRLT